MNRNRQKRERATVLTESTRTCIVRPYKNMYAANYPDPTMPTPTSTSAQEPPVPVNVPDISSVSIASKIPDFWPENPRLWFGQVEAILTPQKHRILHGFVHPYIILSFTPTTTFGSIQVI